MKKELNREDVFTGGKTPELTIYYNIAYFRMAGLINALCGNKLERDKDALEQFMKAFINGKQKLTDMQFVKLCDYLWKGYKYDKNRSEYSLTENDKTMVLKMVAKLQDIRNFQSHIWHDNKVLVFDADLVQFIKNKHLEAIDAQRQRFSKETEVYEKENRELKKKKNKELLFDIHDGLGYITGEGRNFFLSFFLTRGEMTRFLKQRKGCKRDDTPEYKIKHLVYRHFTHRDGATRTHYGYEDNMLDQLPDKQEFLTTRHTYRLINYLNDIPEEVTNPELFPLFNTISNGILIKESVGTYIAFINKMPLLSDFEFSEVWGKDGKPYTNLVEFYHKTQPGFKFRTDLNSFHKIILNLIRDENYTGFFTTQLNLFMAHREELILVISKPLITPNDLLLIEEHYRYKLKANDFVREKLGEWKEKIEKGKWEKANEQKDKLINLLGGVIEITFYDFYWQKDEKPRNENRFMEFAIRFMADFNLLPDCEWEVEPLQIENDLIANRTATPDLKKSGSQFMNQLTDNYRLKFNDGQIAFRYQNQVFIMGHKAVKNLLIACFDGKEKMLNGFMPALLADLKKITNEHILKNHQALNTLSLLNNDSIPSYISRQWGEAEPITDMKKKAIARMDYITQQFEALIENHHYLNRADKNRQIMRCYKFFEWQYPQNSQFKFLRRNEYHRMSIYHYCLDKEQHKYDKKGHNYLYNRLIKESHNESGNIEQHLPYQIRTMLNDAKDFNDYFLRILNATHKILTDWKNQLKQGREPNNYYLSRLGFTGGLTQKVVHTRLLPFSIHPGIPVSFFYRTEMNQNPSFNLSAKVWNSESPFRVGLKESNYQYAKYLGLFNEIKTQRKIIGKMNQLIAEDALLWQIAKKYLDKCHPKFSEIINQQVNGKQPLNVKAIHDTELTIDFPVDKNLYQVVVKMKQLDDFMFIDSKPVLEKTIRYMIKNSLRDKEYQQRVFIETNPGVFKIPYNEVVEAMRTINHQALTWARLLLDWESKTVKTIPEADKKAKLQEAYNKRQPAFFNFNDICRYADDGKQLKDLRNKTFHTEVPETWTYDEMRENKTIKMVLGINETTFLKKDYAIENARTIE